MEERRKQPSPNDTEGVLRQLPALALLDRLPTAMLCVGELGDIAYANPACADMLGYPDAAAVTRQALSTLLTGHETRSPAHCLDTLRTNFTIVSWNHGEGHSIRTMLSPPLLLRADEPLLIVGITDVTTWLWETNRT